MQFGRMHTSSGIKPTALQRTPDKKLMGHFKIHIHWGQGPLVHLFFAINLIFSDDPYGGNVTFVWRVTFCPLGILFQGGASALQPQLLMLPFGSAVGGWDIGSDASTCWHFEWCFGLHWAIISGLMVAKGDGNIIEKINFLQNLSPNSSVFKDWKWSSVNHWTVTVGLYSNWSPVSSQCLSGEGGSDICWPSRVTDRMDPNHYTQESTLKTVNCKRPSHYIIYISTWYPWIPTKHWQ